MDPEVTTEDLVREVVRTKVAVGEAARAVREAQRACDLSHNKLAVCRDEAQKAWRALVDHIAVLAGDDEAVLSS